jgi:hypothetical protein
MLISIELIEYQAFCGNCQGCRLYPMHEVDAFNPPSAQLIEILFFSEAILIHLQAEPQGGSGYFESSGYIAK